MKAKTKIIIILILILFGVFSTAFVFDYSQKVEALETSVWDGTYLETPNFSGNGTSADPFIIYSAKQLATLSYMVSNNVVEYGGKSYNNSSTYYRLTSNIDLNRINWTPIGNNASLTYTFRAHFDGNFNTISNLTISEVTENFNLGLFGAISGSLSNLNVKNVTILSNTEGDYYIGLVAKAQDTTIYNCHIDGKILINLSSNTVSTTNIGGICGYANNCLITMCDSNVNFQLKSFVLNAGGICGKSYKGIIELSYCRGSISQKAFIGENACVGGISGFSDDTIITECFNEAIISGEISPSSNISQTRTKCAGICGMGNKLTIENCYNKGEIKFDYPNFNLDDQMALFGVGYFYGILASNDLELSNISYCINYAVPKTTMSSNLAAFVASSGMITVDKTVVNFEYCNYLDSAEYEDLNGANNCYALSLSEFALPSSNAEKANYFSKFSTWNIGETSDFIWSFNQIYNNNSYPILSNIMQNMKSVTYYTVSMSIGEKGSIIFNNNKINSSYSIQALYASELTFEYVEASNYYQIDKVTQDGIDITEFLTGKEFSVFVLDNTQIEITFKAKYWNEIATVPFGDGTQENPYIINRAEQLAFIGEKINNSEYNENNVPYNRCYIRLNNNIDCSGRFWNLIGGSGALQSFDGVLDMNYYKINNITTLSENVEQVSTTPFNIIGNGIIINVTRNYLPLIYVCSSLLILTALLIIIFVSIAKKKNNIKKIIYIPNSLAK